MFDETAIAQLRGQNRDTLISRAKIERPGVAASPGGGANTGKRTWDEIADDVPCRLSTMADSPVIVQAGQLRTPERLLATFDLESAAIKQGDRLTITGTDAAAQDWTRVVTVLSMRTPRTVSVMRVYICEDVAPGSA